MGRLRLLSLRLALALSATRVVAQDARPDFDAERLGIGLFRYRTVVEGKEAGKSQIRIRKSDSANFVFSNLVEGAFSQSWEAVASRGFVPISTRLVMGQGKDARTVFELAYESSRVTGFASSGKDPQQPARLPVDAALTSDTVDQRIDWAAVMALKQYASGDQFTFHVYDPGTGSSRVAARVLGLETTTVPAGSFETVRVVYRIEKSRGTETYELLFKKDGPRVLLKERFPNGAVTELVEERP
jgi:Protein of unknown function (DUF3108)